MIVCYFIELWMVFVIGILVVVGFYISVFVFRSQQVTDNSLGMRKRSSFHDSEVLYDNVPINSSDQYFSILICCSQIYLITRIL